ncbi:GNAT family N-acetyltransferase [Staphylococcus hyicus]|uniref:GNAT family N-acetyltransferase n=2 Tax=Staphylococcus hyicus TaxID=1284 RepID=A0ACD5FLD9_STAHY|nr:GNAT family N-acetyltransferase [Staphylococcus hyicus]AJC96556.1 acetyltransferase [Staphylococcus hyicus]MCQ9290307.1 GNAT family N-acetyltransferase [Staphylococcus hyicus]MCQ9301272.1 GNAT family N-acetyltransferase [Staphylococcus hyicus]MCQ9305549.1 GNAT family N-acetyltransferase [Staphylococcus hyicus]MCQ9307961.1 GNAT family N-acetyltransferase [Staphylococcus hyicus]
MIKKVESEKEYQDVLSIRMTVFVDEQNVPKEEEIDEFEHISTHFIAYDDNGMALATARYRIVDSIVKVERVAVLKDARGLGVGKQLMLFLENDALQQGYTQFKLGAQTHAIPFYEALGYTAYGDQFLDAGIPHYFMKKQVRL